MKVVRQSPDADLFPELKDRPLELIADAGFRMRNERDILNGTFVAAAAVHLMQCVDEIKFLLPVRLSAQQATRYYARPYTARSRAGHKNILYADSPQAAVYRTREMNELPESAPSATRARLVRRGLSG